MSPAPDVQAPGVQAPRIQVLGVQAPGVQVPGVQAAGGPRSQIAPGFLQGAPLLGSV